jgi:hypothetical protein
LYILSSGEIFQAKCPEAAKLNKAAIGAGLRAIPFLD